MGWWLYSAGTNWSTLSIDLACVETAALDCVSPRGSGRYFFRVGLESSAEVFALLLPVASLTYFCSRCVHGIYGISEILGGGLG